MIYGLFGYGMVSSATTALVQVVLPVEMRIAPTAVETPAMSGFGVQYGGTTQTPSAISMEGGPVTNTRTVSLQVSGTGMAVNAAVRLISNINAATYLGFSAEL